MDERPAHMVVIPCPFLGLFDDSSIVRTVETQGHRCYAQRPPASIGGEHQNEYCLSGEYASCPHFTMPKEGGLEGAYQTSSAVRQRQHRRNWLATGLAALIMTLLAGVVYIYGLDWLHVPDMGEAPIAFAPTEQTAVTIRPTPSVTPTPSTSTPQSAAVADTTTASVNLLQPSPVPTDRVINLSPQTGIAGWWTSRDDRRNHLDDSFLYVGSLADQTYISAAQFSLSGVARGAPIHAATLRLTGLRDDRFDPAVEATWLVQLVAQESLDALNEADFLTAYSAPASITLALLSSEELAAGKANAFEFEPAVLLWLEQQLLNGAQSMSVRLLADTDGETLFAWDSGVGPETAGNAPTLTLSIGEPPPTPPPLPTKPFMVATLTPVPENLVTVVAQANTATAVAETVGTYTPLPYDVQTPTPFPENLATVQAVALFLGLPPIVPDTPTPANAAEAKTQSELATAVALTTGTYTPVPTNAVTPALILPSPPAENVATAAARVLKATEAASVLLRPTSTPLPYNAVLAQYVYATPRPTNAEAAATVQQAAIDKAQVDGTSTPLPWNAVVITKVPDVKREPTPIPLFISSNEFTPTPTPTELPPDVLPDFVRGKILFKSNRSGSEGVYVLDLATGDVSLVTQPWVYPLAARDLAYSPDRKRMAQVGADDRGRLQIQVHSFEYNTTKEITYLESMTYDPAWSPNGDRIVFVSTGSGNDEIYTISPEGEGMTMLTHNQWEWDKHPTWSPDGSRIVFYSNRDTGRRQLWLMNSDGSNQTNISGNEYEDWDPIWVW
ncbi:MAG: PD40 domain-containing protein [Caldilineaceae bacterium]|nr:PD40 domain-containing protein [Caldilineaceae bacterium]